MCVNGLVFLRTVRVCAATSMRVLSSVTSVGLVVQDVPFGMLRLYSRFYSSRAPKVLFLQCQKGRELIMENFIKCSNITQID